MVVVLDKAEFINKFIMDQLVYKQSKDKGVTKNREKPRTKKKKDQVVIVTRDPQGKVLFTDRHLADIKKRYEAGSSMTAIGKFYGVSRQTIKERLKEMIK